MTSSLKDQLLQLGFKKPEPQPRVHERKPKPDAKGRSGDRRSADGQSRRRQNDTPTGRDGRSQEEIDLAKAYALRRQHEKNEQQRLERERAAETQRRREARQKLATLLQGKVLNDPKAELPRHFEYGGKIRRVYVTADQLRAVNAGELAVLQVAGRYQLVDLDIAGQADQLQPGCIALRVDPTAAPTDDYADPRFQVPDDLVW